MVVDAYMDSESEPAASRLPVRASSLGVVEYEVEPDGRKLPVLRFLEIANSFGGACDTLCGEERPGSWGSEVKSSQQASNAGHANCLAVDREEQSQGMDSCGRGSYKVRSHGM